MRAREKLFGKQKVQWPFLQSLVDAGALLRVDLAYAKDKGALDEKEALTHALLFAFARRGHLCMEKSPPFQELTSDVDLQREMRRFLEKQDLPERSYLPKNKKIEGEIVQGIATLLEREKTPFQPLHDTKLTEEQREAVTLACARPFCLITGGPGTGKTFVATKIVESHCVAGKNRVYLTAPTGKAAAHLASKIKEGRSIRTSTLHSLIDQRDPLFIPADLIIVDEASMVPPLLFARLLQSIGPETTLVLMGDVHQLPAVEGGSIFADLIREEDLIPQARLTKCLRSDSEEITELAARILDGTAGDIRTLDLGMEVPSQFYENLWRQREGVQILSTLRKGPLGVDALNRFFHEKFSEERDWHPIMITRNDKETGLANGEVGKLIKNEIAIFGEKEFPASALPPFEYAYCLSVHKSQGSEYDHVLLLVPPGSGAFGREVLYTAVTRARRTIAIDGAPEEIEKALARSTGKISGIGPRLKDAYEISMDRSLPLSDPSPGNRK